MTSREIFPRAESPLSNRCSRGERASRPGAVDSALLPSSRAIGAGTFCVAMDLKTAGDEGAAWLAGNDDVAFRLRNRTRHQQIALMPTINATAKVSRGFRIAWWERLQKMFFRF